MKIKQENKVKAQIKYRVVHLFEGEVVEYELNHKNIKLFLQLELYLVVIKLCYAPRWTTLHHFTVAALRVQMNVAAFLQSQIITGVHLHLESKIVKKMQVRVYYS